MKAHIYISEEPIQPGRDLDSMCGRTIKNANILHAWDSLEVGGQEPLSTLLFCSKCVPQIFKMQEKRYVYAIVEGVEAMVEQ